MTTNLTSVLGAVLALVGAAAGAEPLGPPIADRAMTVVHAEPGRSFLVSLPATEQQQQIRHIAEADIPPAEKLALAAAAGRPQVLEMTAGKTSVALDPERRKIPLAHPGGMVLEQEIYTVDGASGRIAFTRPDFQPALRHPLDPARFVTEREGALFLLDAEKASGRFLGSPRAFRAFLADEEKAGGATYREPVWALAPHWSPDGTRIAFTTNRDTAKSAPHAFSLWIHDLATGRERAVVAGKPGSDGPMRADVPASIVAVDLAGRERVLVPHGHFVALSEGGRVLVWRRVMERENVYHFLNLVTGDQGEIFRPAGSGWYVFTAQASFSAKADRLQILVADPKDRVHVLVFDVADRKKRLFEVPADGRFPLWPTWAGDRLVVALQSLGQKWAGTYLIDPETPEGK